MKRAICILFIILSAPGLIKSQSEKKYEDIKIDVFLSKSIVQNTKLQNVLFLNDIALTDNRNLYLASNNCFYRIGFGLFDEHIIKGKKITTFCSVGNNIFFADKKTLYIIDSNGKESVYVTLPQTPQKIWAGSSTIYWLTKQKNNTYKLYGLLINTKKNIEIWSSKRPVLDVAEFSGTITLLSDNKLYIIDINQKKQLELPLKQELLGKASNIAADNANGSIFISSATGTYMISQKKITKICKDSGLLCYDNDGLIIFTPNDKSLIRLRNEIIYTPEKSKGVIIEILD